MLRANGQSMKVYVFKERLESDRPGNLEGLVLSGEVCSRSSVWDRQDELGDVEECQRSDQQKEGKEEDIREGASGGGDEEDDRMLEAKRIRRHEVKSQIDS